MQKWVQVEPQQRGLRGRYLSGEGAPSRLRVSRGARYPHSRSPLTLAPLCSSASAKALPMPCAAPVTSATLPFTCMVRALLGWWASSASVRAPLQRFFMGHPHPSAPFARASCPKSGRGGNSGPGLGARKCVTLPRLVLPGAPLSPATFAFWHWRSRSPSPRLEGCAGDAGWEGGVATLEVALRARTTQSPLPCPPYPFNPH